MTLGFMQKWPKSMGMKNEKTYFIEKIWSSLTWENDYYSFRDEFKHKFNCFWDGAWTDDAESSFQPKLHTIRHDESERWKPGMNIHFVINSRTKDRFQFAPVIPVISVQEIEILKKTPKTFVCGIVVLMPREFGGEYIPFEVKVDGTMLNEYEIKTLAKNDGFESVEDFFKYFNKYFKGRLIHWTNLSY